MSTRLTVSTQCPTCGADLDFSEGTNAVQCRFCSSNLLVTGRKHVLSYSIAPTLNKHRAVARVLLAHKEQGQPCRVIKPQLYFVPYYRLTGHDLRWERAAMEPAESNAETRHALLSSLTATPERAWGDVEPAGGWSSLFSRVSGAISSLVAGIPPIAERRGAPDPPPPSPASTDDVSAAALAALMTGGKGGGVNGSPDGALTLRDRYVEKNFVATDLSGAGLYSLGVRPNVLRLNLYHHGNLSALGSVVGATIPPDTALERALKTDAPRPMVFRRIFGYVLSLIYFPYWVVETERAGARALTVVDAVSETVLVRDVPTAFYGALETVDARPAPGIGFRPLVCPNCGWDFPVRPDEVIFVCASCSRAWQIYRDLLSEVAYQIADAPGGGSDQRTYLPFWRLTVAVGDEDPRELTVPAFRYRRLKVLNDLATALSAVAPAITPYTGPAPALHGCFYDQEDAVLLAQVAYISLTRTPEAAATTFEERRFRVEDMILTWLPFQRDGTWLSAPYTQQQLSPQLLA